MTNEELQSVLLGIIGMAAVVTAIGGFLFPVRGLFRDSSDGTTVEFSQFGPFVKGRSTIEGGRREYSGWSFFGRGRLIRRDFGERLLKAQGYPQSIAVQREGQVAARLEISRDNSDLISVQFRGARVDFTKRPERITNVTFVDATKRVFERAAS